MTTRPPVPARGSPVVVESLAAFVCVGVVALVQAWTSRWQVNPDGVAYLDLADAIRHGAWAQAVQGYWSPLYPALLAITRLAGAPVGLPAVPAAHALNAALVILGAAQVHGFVSAKAAPEPQQERWWARGVWAVYAVVALQLTRASAITPDQLLLVCLVFATSALLRRDGPRPVACGLALGAAFVAKTSIWPWFIATLATLCLPRVMRIGRPVAARLAVAAVVPAVLWTGALSWREGRLTPGSTAALNACWYLRACDSRTPDTHAGGHQRYRSVPLAGGGEVTYAEFVGEGWTYEPWSDPTAWDRGVTTRSQQPLRPEAYLTFAMGNLVVVLRDTLRYFVLGPLLLLAIAVGIRGPRAPADPDQRARAVAVAALAGVGVLQFVLVHVEPRLLAPFAATLGLALYTAFGAGSPARAPGSERRGKGPTGNGEPAPWPIGGWLAVGALVLVGWATWHEMRDDLRVGRAVGASQRSLLEASQASIRGARPARVVVIGEALALSTYARALDIRVVAQVLPRSLPALDALSPPEQATVLRAIGGGSADLAWRLRPDGSVAMVPLR